MHSNPPSDEPSPAQRYGLFVAALAAALLGLTTLALDGPVAAKHARSSAAERTPECIVASALFVGVPSSLP